MRIGRRAFPQQRNRLDLRMRGDEQRTLVCEVAVGGRARNAGSLGRLLRDEIRLPGAQRTPCSEADALVRQPLPRGGTGKAEEEAQSPQITERGLGKPANLAAGAAFARGRTVKNGPRKTWVAAGGRGPDQN